MARKEDDLLMDDDLAAFIDQSDDLLSSDDSAAEEIEEVLPVEDITEDLPEQAPEDWDGDAEADDDIPGQLAVDVFETKDKLIVKARTAGISGKDLDVSVRDNYLTVSGTLHGSDEEDVDKWHLQECYWGVFSRTIALPVTVQEEGVQASLKNGILTISFDKIQPPATNKVSVIDL